MKRPTVTSVFSLILSLIGSGPCLAAPGDPDERLDYYEVTGDAQMRRIADATCFATHRSLLALRADGDFDLAVSAFNSVEGHALCKEMPFYGQATTGDFSGSTATLVGEDLVLCARHAFPADSVLSARAFIFDYHQTAPNEPPYGLPAGSTIRVDADDVFYPIAVVAVSKQGHDWTLVRLDRPVPLERIPIPLQPGDTTMFEGEEALVVGHGDRLTKKFSRGLVRLNTSGFQSYFLVNCYIRPGNSGSPAISAETGRLHAVVTAGGPEIEPTPEGCYTICTLNEPHCDPIGRADILDPRLLLNVPPISLQCDAPATVQHFGPPGGPFTQSESMYQLTVPAGSRAVDYRITVDGGSWIEVLADGPGLSGHIKPGEGVSAMVRLTSEASTLLPGAFHAKVTFHDDTFFTRTVVRYTIHVGVGAITVSPECGILGDGPGALLWTEKTYTVTNRCDVPVAVDIQSGAPWVHVDHMPAEQIIVPAQGHADVLVNLFRDCDTVGVPGIYETDVSFAPNFGPGRPPESFTRPIRMDFGRWYYQHPDQLPLELEIGVNEHFIDVNDTAALEDLDVEIIGAVFPRFLTSHAVYVTSPAGTRVDLINVTHHGGQFGSAPSLLDGVFDDETSPPADPQGLAALIGEQIRGRWTITVEQVGTPSAENGTLTGAVLRIRGPKWSKQPPCGDPGEFGPVGIDVLMQFLELLQAGDADLNLDGAVTVEDLLLLLKE